MYMYGMLTSLTVAGTWLMVATYWCLAVSTTHSISEYTPDCFPLDESLMCLMSSMHNTGNCRNRRIAQSAAISTPLRPSLALIRSHPLALALQTIL